MVAGGRSLHLPVHLVIDLIHMIQEFFKMSNHTIERPVLERPLLTAQEQILEDWIQDQLELDCTKKTTTLKLFEQYQKFAVERRCVPYVQKTLVSTLKRRFAVESVYFRYEALHRSVARGLAFKKPLQGNSLPLNDVKEKE